MSEPMKPNTIYICGPMSGYPERNFPAFYAAAKKLRSAGYTVINPAELHGEVSKLSDATRQTCLRRDIEFMVRECSGVALLPNFADSRGARLEIIVAGELGMSIKLVDQWVEDVG